MGIEINAIEIIETILTAWYFSSFLQNGHCIISSFSCCQMSCAATLEILRNI